MMNQPVDVTEIATRGQELYESRIRPLVERDNRGKFLVLDLESGEYELDDDDLEASRRARAKHPTGLLYALRVGFPTAYRLGSTTSTI